MLFAYVQYEKVLVFISVLLYMLKSVTDYIRKKWHIFFFVHRIAGLGGFTDVTWQYFVSVGEIFTKKFCNFVSSAYLCTRER